jgi:hypothetical protein
MGKGMQVSVGTGKIGYGSSNQTNPATCRMHVSSRSNFRFAPTTDAGYSHLQIHHTGAHRFYTAGTSRLLETLKPRYSPASRGQARGQAGDKLNRRRMDLPICEEKIRGIESVYETSSII